MLRKLKWWMLFVEWFELDSKQSQRILNFTSIIQDAIIFSKCYKFSVYKRDAKLAKLAYFATYFLGTKMLLNKSCGEEDKQCKYNLTWHIGLTTVAMEKEHYVLFVPLNNGTYPGLYVMWPIFLSDFDGILVFLTNFIYVTTTKFH